MDPEYSRIIGLEVVTDNLFETDAIREFLQKEQASVGRKFAAIEVIFELLIEMWSNKLNLLVTAGLRQIKIPFSAFLSARVCRLTRRTFFLPDSDDSVIVFHTDNKKRGRAPSRQRFCPSSIHRHASHRVIALISRDSMASNALL